jgi:putative methyltransferase (TIGR04325 family)
MSAQTQPGAVNTALNLVNRFLGLGPNRRILQAIGEKPAAKRWLNYLSRSCGVFDSFSEAEQARLRHHPSSRGHLNTNLISSNFEISARLRTSDYPVLFWLRQILSDEPLRVFDFGGGQGQTFVAMAPLLGVANIKQWVVNDLPEVTMGAESLAFPEGAPPSISYSSELADAKTSNVFLAAGSLHYWIEPMETLIQKLEHRPEHLIINRSPMRSSGRTYYTVQEGGHWAVPCIVREFEALKAELAELGYQLSDCWTAPEKFLHRPWLPSFSCPYQGAYFRRVN